jgi:hypothetical protein
MAEKISWMLSVQVIGGPKVSASQTTEVEAYDKIQVTVAAGASNKAVEVQPGGSGQVTFLLITSNKYDPSKLTYKVNDGTSTTTFTLDAPQFLMGRGGVALLDPAPKTLFFSNTLTEDVSVEILVGRDATP